MSATQDLVVRYKAENTELKNANRDLQKQFNELQKSIRDLNQAGQQNTLGGVFKNLKGQAGLLNGQFGSLIGTAGRFGSVLGVVGVAAEGFRQAVIHNEGAMDGWRAAVDAGKAGIETFWNAVARGDFSSFADDLNAATEAAEAAYRALDDLETFKTFNRVKMAELNTQYHHALLLARDRTKTEAERLKYLAQARSIMAQQTALLQRQVKLNSILANRKMDQALAENGLNKLVGDRAMIKWYFNNFDIIDKRAKDYEAKMKMFAKQDGGKNYGSMGAVVGQVGGDRRKQEYLNSAIGQKEQRAWKFMQMVDKNGEAVSAALQAYEASEALKQQVDDFNFQLDQAEAKITGGANGKGGGSKSQEAVYRKEAKTIAHMTENVKALNKQLQDPNISDERYKAITKEIDQWNIRILQQQLEGAGVSLDSMQKSAQLLNKMLNGMDPKSKEFKETAKALGVAERRQQEVTDLLEEAKEFVYEEADSYNKLTHNLDVYQKQMNRVEIYSDAWYDIMQKVVRVQDRIAEQGHEIALEQASLKGETKKYLTALIASFEDQLSEIDLSLPVTPEVKANYADLQRMINEAARRVKFPLSMLKADSLEGKTPPGEKPSKEATKAGENESKRQTRADAEERIGKIQQDYEIGIIGYQEAKAQIDELNQQIQKLGMEPVEINIQSKKLKKTLRDVSYAAEAVGSLGDAASSLGQAFESPELNVAGIIAQTIANIALSTSQAIMQSTSMGPWGWIAFSVAAMAEMAAMIAQIHSVTGYATGGIVQGSSYSGDQVNARLNSGEMVLNRRQQTHLFDALDSGRIGGDAPVMDVEWRLRGSDLYGSVRNYSRTTARAGRKTGIR